MPDRYYVERPNNIWLGVYGWVVKAGGAPQGVRYLTRTGARFAAWRLNRKDKRDHDTVTPAPNPSWAEVGRMIEESERQATRAERVRIASVIEAMNDSTDLAQSAYTCRLLEAIHPKVRKDKHG